MNQKEKKEWILSTLQSGGFSSIYPAMKVLGSVIDSLENVPFGMRNEPTRIATDLADGRLTAEQTIAELVEFVSQIPD